VPDIIDQQQPGSPWYWMKEKREADRTEGRCLQRAFNDWQVATQGSYISPAFQFAAVVQILDHYFKLVPRYRDASVYPADPIAVRKELRKQEDEPTEERAHGN
jgi:hypothetical protein